MGRLGPIERAEAGKVLALMGDPRFRREEAFCLPDEPLLGFVEIPAGPFVMGSNDRIARSSRQTPNHRVTIPTYYMARYPVTNTQYAVFVRETGYKSNNT